MPQKYCGLEENKQLKAYETQQDLQHPASKGDCLCQVIKVVRINAYA